MLQKKNTEKVRDAIKKDYPKLEMSPQNKKLNRYAERLMEKLKDGQEVRIVDAVRAEDVIICPECGVQCAPGSQYCMECGAGATAEVDEERGALRMRRLYREDKPKFFHYREVFWVALGTFGIFRGWTP